MRLNLGSNDRRIDGFLSVDMAPPADVICDLSQTPWPWPDSSADEIAAFDVVEHLPSRIVTMNECWRILKPGGRLHITTPNAAKGGGYFQDPTHITPWTINSFKYFAAETAEHRRFAGHYGISAKFQVVALTETNYQDGPVAPGAALPDPVYKLEVILEAVK